MAPVGGLLALITATALAAWLSAAAVAQAPAAAPVAFEVASVKPHRSGSQRVSMGFTPGGYAASNVPLRLLVLSAYGVRPAQTNPCRISGTIGAAAGSVLATGQSMADLATYLGQNADRLVADRTGLQGRFDFELEWTAASLSAAPALVDPTPASSDRAELFTAVQEQLGLKLEPARGPVPFVVIDHAELPTPD